MVYINSDGTVGSRPWYKQLSCFCWNVVNFVSAFFRTLINPGLNGRADNYVTDYRRPGGPPKPPSQRFGRFATLSSCQAPMPGGG